MALLATLSATALAGLSSILGNLTLFGLIMVFLVIGALRKVKVYEAFVEGAKEGFDVAKNLLPYLVAMLCAVGVCAHPERWISASTAFAIWCNGRAWTRVLSMRCRPRWSSRSLAAPRGRC
jgi:hypothetical protein